MRAPHNLSFFFILISLSISFTPKWVTAATTTNILNSTRNGVETHRRILHQPLFPEGSAPPPGTDSIPPPSPPPPTVPSDSSNVPSSEYPFFHEGGPTPDQSQTPPSPSNGTMPIPVATTQPAKQTKTVAIAISVGIVTLGMLSALAFFLYRHRAKHPRESEAQKLVGGSSRDNSSSSVPPSNFLYIGTVEPSQQRGSITDGSRGEKMAKIVGAFICIVSMDVIAGILGIVAEIEQNKVKYLRLWIFECRAPSEQAFKLGLGAATLLGLAHVIANLSQGCAASVPQEELRRASPRRKLSVALLKFTWIIFALGLSMLVIGTLSNHKSRAPCGFNFTHLHFLSIGANLCFVHCLFSVSYYVSTITAW